MDTKYKILAGGGLLVVSFACGYFLAPTRIKIEKEIVEVEKKTKESQIDTDRNKHKDTTITETIHPDGTRDVTTHTIEDTNMDRHSTSSESSIVSIKDKESKEVTKSTSHLTLSLLAGTKLSFDNSLNPLVYGGHVTKDILGPINIGVWGLSDKTIGASVGLTF